MELNNQTAKKLRKDFPIFRNNPGLVYLDNAATSQKPREVIEGISRFYSRDYSNIHRGVYKLSEKSTELYFKSKELVAGLINAKPEEIVYTRNTTESINLLSYVLSGLLKSKKKKEIVLSDMEHHSNLIPWQQLAKRDGFKLKFIRLKLGTYEIDLEDAKKKITDKTAIVSLIHISNSFGTVNPVKEIFKIAREKKALTVLDAAQSAPHLKVDVKSLGCDFLAFSGHKVLGPSGIGVLYGRKTLLEKMDVFMTGGEMIRKVTSKTASWAEIPRKFEAGTPNIAGAVGLGIAMKYLQKIGVENIDKWEKKLLAYALSKMKDVPGIKIYNNSKQGSGIISFNLEKVPPHDVASLLDGYGITIRAGHHCCMPLMKKLGIQGTCRVSFYLYNTFEDVDKLVDALKKISRRFE
ncbi:MAG: cysteine desulfurase [Candidatus Pacearchaeota archaeon]